MEPLLTLTKALADGTRLRILSLLRAAERSAGELSRSLGLSPSTVSRHLDLLRRAGLIEVRRRGRWAHCRLADSEGPGLPAAALRWILDALEAADAARPEPPSDLLGRASVDPSPFGAVPTRAGAERPREPAATPVWLGPA